MYILVLDTILQICLTPFWTRFGTLFDTVWKQFGNVLGMISTHSLTLC